MKIRLSFGVLLAWLLGSLACCADARIPDVNDPRTVPAATSSLPPEIQRNFEIMSKMAQSLDAKDAMLQKIALSQADAQAPLTDWASLGAGFVKLFFLLSAIYMFLKKHHAELSDAQTWVNLIASCYQKSGGDPTAALALVPAAHQEVFSSAPSATDMAEAKHALAALHLEAQGPVEEDPEIVKAKQNLATLMAKKAVSVVAAMLMLAMVCGLSGCTAGKRPQSLMDAEAKMVARYEADHANQAATNSGYDAALLQAQTNYFTELHNERIRDIQNGVAADPTKAADGIAAAAAANTTLMNQIAAQQAAQAGIRNIVTQSTATNIVQARQLDAAIRNYDNTAPFSAAAAAQSVATTVQSLIPPPTPISTAPTPAVKPATGAPVTTPKPVTPAPAGTIVN